ncbi:odorant receptor 22c-like isoform X2 [Linepithema humile]|uniref:odorant receptor 22c-like isoform X2 n=2 Tax=Linepithema humile TaxID=83485 RepID=UPI00351E761E
MKGKITLDRVIAFLKIYLAFACCWPLSPNATRLQRLRRDALRCLCFANSTIFSIVMIYTICKRSDDILLVMKVGCQLSVSAQIPLQMLLFAMQNKRLQSITSIMEDYYRQALKYEREIFQKYIDKCKLLYGGILSWLMMTGISVAIGPLFLPQPFPGEAEYPFDAQYQPVKSIIYAHHLLLIYQSVTQVGANTFAALLLWFVAARFDILSVRIRMITNIKQLVKCTHEHNMLLRFAKEVTYAIRYVALLCVTFSTGGVIFGCLTFMSRQPWSVKWTFLMIAFCSFVELYMFAWPADNVINTSNDVASAAYDSLWYNNNVAMQKILIYVILRSQRSVTISIPLALPNLSMNYYASYISTVFSYMAFVRIIMGEE